MADIDPAQIIADDLRIEENIRREPRRSELPLLRLLDAARAERDRLAEQLAAERAKVADAWDEGYRSGHSRAMRLMSDEPGVEPGTNPLRAALAGEGEAEQPGSSDA